MRCPSKIQGFPGHRWSTVSFVQSIRASEGCRSLATDQILVRSNTHQSPRSIEMTQRADQQPATSNQQSRRANHFRNESFFQLWTSEQLNRKGCLFVWLDFNKWQPYHKGGSVISSVWSLNASMLLKCPATSCQCSFWLKATWQNHECSRLPSVFWGNCLWPQAFHKVDCAWGVRVGMMLPQSWSSKPPKCQAFRPMCVQLWSARMPRSAQAGIQRIILCYLWALKKYNTWNFASTSLSCLLCTSGVSCIPQCPPINLFTNTLQIPL